MPTLIEKAQEKIIAAHVVAAMAYAREMLYSGDLKMARDAAFLAMMDVPHLTDEGIERILTTVANTHREIYER